MSQRCGSAAPESLNTAISTATMRQDRTRGTICASELSKKCRLLKLCHACGMHPTP